MVRRRRLRVQELRRGVDPPAGPSGVLESTGTPEAPRREVPPSGRRAARLGRACALARGAQATQRRGRPELGRPRVARRARISGGRGGGVSRVRGRGRRKELGGRKRECTHPHCQRHHRTAHAHSRAQLQRTRAWAHSASEATAGCAPAEKAYTVSRRTVLGAHTHQRHAPGRRKGGQVLHQRAGVGVLSSVGRGEWAEHSMRR